MKRLTHIHADGLKQLRGVELQVPRLLALTGPNGAGKTSLMQAVRIAVLGYEPSVEKTLAGLRQLAPTGEMEVGLTFDDGFGVHRKIGASKVTTVTPPLGERTEAERSARIARETGAFVPAFDLGEFLSLSAEKRREALFKMLPRDGAVLTEAVFREWLGYEAADDLVRRAIDKLWLERLLEAESPVDGLASAIDYVRERFNAGELARLDQVAVVEKMDATAAAATTSSEKALAAGEDLDALQEELAAATERLGELQARANEASAAERRRLARDQQMRDTVSCRNQTQDRIAALEAVAASAPAAAPDPVALEVATGAVDAAREAAGSARLSVATAEGKVTGAIQRVTAARERLMRLGKADACPVCGTHGANLDAMRAQLEESVAAAEAELTTLVEERRAAEAVLDGAKRDLEAAIAARNQVQTAERDARAAAERVASAATEIATLRARVEGYEQLLAQLAAEEVSTPPPADAAALSEALQAASGLRARISAEQARRHEVSHAQGKAAAERERADRERQELAMRTARAAALKGVLQALQKLRGHVIQQMIAPVEDTAAEILAGIDPAKRFRIVFERENRDVFDYGFEQDGEFRGFIAASEGEGALLTMVFVAALIAAVQPAWPLLMIDGLEKVDDFDGVHHRRALMDALARIGDRFGNVIVAGCVDFGEPEGWTVVDVRTLAPQGGVSLPARKRAPRQGRAA